MKKVKWFYALQKDYVYIEEFFMLGSQADPTALELFKYLCEEHSKKKRRYK